MGLYYFSLLFPFDFDQYVTESTLKYIEYKRRISITHTKEQIIDRFVRKQIETDFRLKQSKQYEKKINSQ